MLTKNAHNVPDAGILSQLWVSRPRANHQAFKLLSHAPLHLRVSIEHCPPRSFSESHHQKYSSHGPSISFFFFLSIITFKISYWNRSWKILLILAPPDSSFVLTTSPPPSIIFSKSPANVWSMLSEGSQRARKKFPNWNFSNSSWAQFQIHVKFGRFQIREKRRTYWVR